MKSGNAAVYESQCDAQERIPDKCIGLCVRVSIYIYTHAHIYWDFQAHYSY